MYIHKTSDALKRSRHGTASDSTRFTPQRNTTAPVSAPKHYKVATPRYVSAPIPSQTQGTSSAGSLARASTVPLVPTPPTVRPLRKIASTNVLREVERFTQLAASAQSHLPDRTIRRVASSFTVQHVDKRGKRDFHLHRRIVHRLVAAFERLRANNHKAQEHSIVTDGTASSVHSPTSWTSSPSSAGSSVTVLGAVSAPQSTISSSHAETRSLPQPPCKALISTLRSTVDTLEKELGEKGILEKHVYEPTERLLTQQESAVPDLTAEENVRQVNVRSTQITQQSLPSQTAQYAANLQCVEPSSPEELRISLHCLSSQESLSSTLNPEEEAEEAATPIREGPRALLHALYQSSSPPNAGERAIHMDNQPSTPSRRQHLSPRENNTESPSTPSTVRRSIQRASPLRASPRSPEQVLARTRSSINLVQRLHDAETNSSPPSSYSDSPQRNLRRSTSASPFREPSILLEHIDRMRSLSSPKPEKAESSTTTPALRRSTSASVLLPSTSCMSINSALNPFCDECQEEFDPLDDQARGEDEDDHRYAQHSFYTHRPYQLSVISERTEPLSPRKRSTFSLHATPQSSRTGLASPNPQQTTLPYAKSDRVQSQYALVERAEPLLEEDEGEWEDVKESAGAEGPAVKANTFPKTATEIESNDTALDIPARSRRDLPIYGVAKGTLELPRRSQSSGSAYAPGYNKGVAAIPISAIPGPSPWRLPRMQSHPSNLLSTSDAYSGRDPRRSTNSLRSNSPLSRVENMLEQEGSRLACMIGVPPPDLSFARSRSVSSKASSQIPPEPSAPEFDHSKLTGPLAKLVAETQESCNIARGRRRSRYQAGGQSQSDTSSFSATTGYIRNLPDHVKTRRGADEDAFTEARSSRGDFYRPTDPAVKPYSLAPPPPFARHPLDINAEAAAVGGAGSVRLSSAPVHKVVVHPAGPSCHPAIRQTRSQSNLAVPLTSAPNYSPLASTQARLRRMHSMAKITEELRKDAEAAWAVAPFTHEQKPVVRSDEGVKEEGEKGRGRKRDEIVRKLSTMHLSATVNFSIGSP